MKLQEHHVKALVQLGVPRDTAQLVRDESDLHWKTQMFEGVAGLLLVFGGLAAGLCLGAWMSSPATWLQLGLIPKNSIAVESTPLSMITFLIFGAVFSAVLGCAISSFRESWKRRTVISHLTQFVTQFSPTMRRIIATPMVRRTDDSLDAEDYLLQFFKVEEQLIRAWAWSLLVLALITSLWDGRSAAALSNAGIRAGSHFQWSRDFYSWSDIKKVRTGCYFTNNGTVLNKAYELHLPNGVVVELAECKPTDENAEQLDVMVQVDNHVRKQNIPWEPAIYLAGTMKGHSKWHKKCFEAYRKHLSDEDWQKLCRVYRYPRRFR